MGSPGFKEEKKNQTLWFLRTVQCLLLNRCSLVKRATLSTVKVTYLRTLAVQHQAGTWKPSPIPVPSSPLASVLGAAACTLHSVCAALESATSLLPQRLCAQAQKSWAFMGRKREPLGGESAGWYFICTPVPLQHQSCKSHCGKVGMLIFSGASGILTLLQKLLSVGLLSCQEFISPPEVSG